MVLLGGGGSCICTALLCRSYQLNFYMLVNQDKVEISGQDWIIVLKYGLSYYAWGGGIGCECYWFRFFLILPPQ